MTLKITTLVENSPGENHALQTEHGICFHVEKDGSHLLFDVGQTDMLIRNAQRLCIDLSNLQYVAISHGHYDHSGGLRPLTRLTREFKLLVGQGFFAEKYGSRNNVHDYLGNDFDENFLHDQDIATEILDEPVREILPGIFAVTQFDRIHADEIVNPRFVIRDANGFRPDAFSDELLLAVDTPKGLVVLLGCSHPGVKNMLDTVTARLNRPLYAVLGGTHLVEASPESMTLTRTYLKQRDVKVLGVSHCTGKTGTQCLSTLEDMFFYNCTGSSLFVD